MATEKQILDESLARTHTTRRAHGIDETTGRAKPSKALATPASAVRMKTTDTPMTISTANIWVPPVGIYACNAKVAGGKTCGNPIALPGICEACGKRTAEREVTAAIRARVKGRIPEIYRDATWASLPSLMNMSGDGPRLKIVPARVEKIRTCLETEKRSILVGPTGSGKSTLAASYIHEALLRGSERARFIEAVLVDDTDEGMYFYNLALGATELVIDDLAAELANAPAEGGLAAQRMKLIFKLINLRFSRNLGTVITTPYDKPGLGKIYGMGIVRRLFDGAGVIRLGKVEIEAS